MPVCVHELSTNIINIEIKTNLSIKTAQTRMNPYKQCECLKLLINRPYEIVLVFL